MVRLNEGKARLVTGAGPTATPMLTGTLDRSSLEVKEATDAALSMRELLAPEDQANAAACLCSDEAPTITGATLDVDGGFLA